MIDLTKLSYEQLTQLQTRVRKEWVARNKKRYTSECFPVGSIVKFRGKRLGIYHAKLRHAEDGDVYFGEVTRAQIQRTGRIQVYLIKYLENTEEKVIARGIRQVEKPTEEEIKGYTFTQSVRGT
jgi:hypothetical protein